MGTWVFCLILPAQLVIKLCSFLLKQSTFCSSAQTQPLQEDISLDKRTFLLQGTHAEGKHIHNL